MALEREVPILGTDPVLSLIRAVTPGPLIVTGLRAILPLLASF
jgi:hypothetical protein